MVTNYWNKKANDYDNHLKKSELAYKKVIELIKNEINKSNTFLDIGTGTGEIPIALSDNINKIFAIDFSPEMINVSMNKIKKLNINNITFQVQDCYNLTFNNEMFDVILAINIIHLLDKPEKFLSSIKNILKKNGKLIIPTYLHNENIKTKIISTIMKYKGHPIITRFDSNSMIDFIENCGFNVNKKVLIPNIIPMMFIVASKKL